MQMGAPTPVKPGDLVGAKYRVEKVLGQGGMAVVVAARHMELDELVAIKVLLPHRAEKDDVRLRFAREARAAVKIKSEHVARVLDVGTLEGGLPFIVMEHLEGEDLASTLARRGRLPPNEAILYVLQVCDALREAHALGIVHRDVKPANLFVARTPGRPPRVKVLDFGISKVEQDDKRCTETKEVLGSPWYMAPEQMHSARDADARADIWSVGVILYELVTGEVPFDGDSMTEVIVHVLHEDADLGKVPAALVDIVGRCLEKDPARRYGDIDELATALRTLERVHVTAVESLVEEDDGEVVDAAELLPTPMPSDVDIDLEDLSEAIVRDSTTAMTSVIDSRTTVRPPPPSAKTKKKDRSTLLYAAGSVPLGLAIAIAVSTGTGKTTTKMAATVTTVTNATAAEVAVVPVVSEPVVNEPVLAEPPVVTSTSGESAVPAASHGPVARPIASATTTTLTAPGVTGSAPAKGDDALLFVVARKNSGAIRECWVASAKTSAVATVSAEIAANGTVATVSVASTDAPLARCLEGKVKAWAFPPGAKSVRLPLRLGRF